MSEKEFENYLTLLRSMLTFQDRKKEDISQELCDYLEDRFEELVQAGYSPDQAKAKALEELGDAAKVASLFSRVSNQNFRRSMMKYASVSIFGCFLLIVMFVSMWPDSSRIQPIAPSIAQEKQADAKSASVQSTSNPKPANQMQAREVIQQRTAPPKTRDKELEKFFYSEGKYTSTEIVEAKLENFVYKGAGLTTLDAFVNELKTKYRLQVVLLPSLVEEHGIDPATVEFSLQGDMQLLQAIRDALLKSSTGLDEYLMFSIIEGTVYIGTSSSSKLLTVHVYDMTQLLNEMEVSREDIEDTYYSVILRREFEPEELPLKWLDTKLVIRHAGPQHLETLKLFREIFPDFEKVKRKELVEVLERELKQQLKKEKELKKLFDKELNKKK